MKLLYYRKRSRNQGFSLIEVLLAICVLGLVATPILQVLYSSYSMNQKSRKYLAASDFAQTVLEAISAQSWENSNRVDNKTSADGLKKYYIDDTKKKYTDDHLEVVTMPIYLLPSGNISGGAPYADIPLPTSTIDKKEVVYFRNVTFNGFCFCGILEFDTSNANDRYYTIPVKLTVYDADPDGNHIRDDADFKSTNISGVSEINTFTTSVINNTGITK